MKRGLEILFDPQGNAPSSSLHTHFLQSTLLRLLPEEEGNDFDVHLPLVKWSFKERTLSLYLLSFHRPNGGKFFFDLVTRWIVQGNSLSTHLLFSADFKIAEKEGMYTLSEVGLTLSPEVDLTWLESQLSILEEEVLLGISSAYHASRLLETTGISSEIKSAAIQRNIALVRNRYPLDFDHDFTTEMHHFIATAPKEFKSVREERHLSRLICIFTHFHQLLQRRAEAFPTLRHINVKLYPVRLHFSWGIRSVLALFVGMNFLKEGELFDESHLLRACQTIIPGVAAVPDSHFFSDKRAIKHRVMYLEIEKENGAPFSKEEIHHLRARLFEELKSAVEQWTRPLFMPRNEEEVMRNILILSQQLKYTKDLPQVILSFHQQIEGDLSFTVIILRLIYPDSPSIQTLFSEKSTLHCTLDRVKAVGLLRNKYPKEAAVLRIRLPAEDFLRKDQSIDLLAARQKVLSHLEMLLGEIRDYNGGMIAKQSEALRGLKKELGDVGARCELLLENFFHSIFPVEMRTTLSLETLKQFFSFFESRCPYKEFPDKCFVSLCFSHEDEVGAFFDSLTPLNLNRSQLIHSTLHIEGKVYLLLLCISLEQLQRDALRACVSGQFQAV